MPLPLLLSVFYLYHLDFDADGAAAADARCGYSLNPDRSPTFDFESHACVELV